MDFFADYHMHTKYSDGRATLKDMVQSAKAKGLKEIAITDHGPKNIGVGVRSAAEYLQIKNATEQASKEIGMQVLCGAEADIISENGDIDVPTKIAAQLDILLVGLHPYVLPKNLPDAYNFVLMNGFSKLIPGARKKVINTNTKTLAEAMYKHDIDIITHPNLGMPIDIKEVAKACAATNTAYEINTGHHFQTVVDVTLAAKEGVNFVVNSDAHFVESIGELSFGAEILAQAKIPAERVINAVKNQNF